MSPQQTAQTHRQAAFKFSQAPTTQLSLRTAYLFLRLMGGQADNYLPAAPRSTTLNHIHPLLVSFHSRETSSTDTYSAYSATFVHPVWGHDIR